MATLRYRDYISTDVDALQRMMDSVGERIGVRIECVPADPTRSGRPT